MADNAVFRLSPIRLITQSSSYIFISPSFPSYSLSVEPTRCFWLPTREEIRTLVDKYIAEMTYIHNFIHNPTMKALVDRVYDGLEKGADTSLGAIFLFVCICATITHSWTDGDAELGIFCNPQEAHAQAVSWTKAALDLFEVIQRNGHQSLECIQALIILTFVLGNLEGISTRARRHMTQAITMARELGLHRIDQPPHSAAWQRPCWNRVEAEVGRRLWWFLVPTDW